MFTLQVNDDIFLRMLSARDAQALFQITDQSRNYLKKWLPWLDDINTTEDSLIFIKSTFYSYNNRTGITAGIFYLEELAGVIGYNSLDFKNNIGSIGYWLAENKQGKGIMTKAVQALVSYGFEELKLNRMAIHVAEENKASRAVAERLGFQYEGHMRQVEWLYDHYVDHIIYSMLHEEWKKH